jgi:hypothetical protein
VQFAADVRDVLSTDERLLEATFWKKLHLGAEVRLSVFSLRGGFNSGYPTFGLGARIPYLGLRADYAFWGDELGRYAGQMPSWNHQISLALSWGDEKGKKYGRAAVKKHDIAPGIVPTEPQKTEAVQQPVVTPETPAVTVTTPEPSAPAVPAAAATAPTPAAAVPVPADAPSPAVTVPALATPATAPAATAEKTADGLAGDAKK